MKSLGTDGIFNILNNDSSVTDLLDQINPPKDINKAIYNGLVLPSGCLANKTILIYQTSPVTGGECYNIINITIDCRGGIPGSTGGLSDAVTIQRTVKNVLDRYNKDGFHVVADMLPPIAPSDDTDNYNAPVSIRMKMA